MLSRIALLVSALLLSGPLLAKDNGPSTRDLCRQNTPVIRDLWQHDLIDAPPGVAAVMVDVIDGKLPQTRQRLAELKPDEIARWRQAAMLTAVWAGQATIVDALLNDGAAVDDLGWIPPFKPSFYKQTVDEMQQDPRFGGPAGVKGLAAAGIVSNQGQRLGPALTTAAECSDVATLDVLLRHHANVMARQAPNVVDALTVATVHGDAVIVQRLLDHGADPCIDDRQIQLRKPGASLANIGRRNGLPETLVQRLACPSVTSTH